MKTQFYVLGAALAVASTLAAQTTVEQVNEARLQQLQQILEIPVGEGIGPVMWEAPLVSGHPYSAIIRRVTKSPDGLHVDRSDTENVYRDEVGRVRNENNGGRNVSILDPAAGIGYNLDTEEKTAVKRTLSPVMIENQTKTPSLSAVEIARQQASRRQNMTVDDLGMQVINGVQAQGVRTSVTIPAGTFGNDRDLKTAVDRWVSTDLHVLVKSVTTDSRSGPTTYELTNITVGPPDASLFQVPQGYTIQEAGRRGAAVAAPAAGGRK